MEIGHAAPNFNRPSQQGDISLKDLQGKYVVLFFYPRDNTSGCTMEAQGFRNAQQAFKDAGAVILGASRDSLKSHQSFCDNHDLPFPLLSDEDESLCIAYDVMKMKNKDGKQVRGIARSTFLIDPKGNIAAVWRKVRVPGHVDDVLSTLNAAQ